MVLLFPTSEREVTFESQERSYGIFEHPGTCPSACVTCFLRRLTKQRFYRVGASESVELFDTSGVRATAIVKQIDSASSTLTISKLVNEADEIARTHITLAVGMPKGTRSDWLVEKATEIGVAALIPLESDHSLLKVKDPKYVPLLST